MKWHKIFDNEILNSPDCIKTILVGGKKLCAVKIADDLFITQAHCPHAGAVLSGGWCEEGKIICPFHRYEYDLKTGRGAKGQNDYIDVYAVERRDDGYYVSLPEKFGFLKKILGGQ